MNLMKRVNPLLERETSSEVVDLAPAPWVLRQCTESGFVYLENPPGYEILHDELAWQITYQRECEARAAAEPIRYAVSTAFKKMRRTLKRNKIADLTESLILKINHPQIRLLDLGCGWGQLLGTVMERLPGSVRQRCVPHGTQTRFAGDTC